MPDTSGFSGAPVPIGAEALNGPGNFAAFRAAIDDRVVLYASSQSNRDTLYANVRKGAIVSCPELGIVWQKKTSPPTAADWRTLAEVGTVVSSGILTAASGFTVSFQYAQRRQGGLWLRGRCAYSGADLVGASVSTSAPGNITDTAVCSLGSSFVPDPALSAFNWVFPAHAGSSVANIRYDATTTSFYLESLVPSYVFGSGQSVSFDLFYPVA